MCIFFQQFVSLLANSYTLNLLQSKSILINSISFFIRIWISIVFKYIRWLSKVGSYSFDYDLMKLDNNKIVM